MKTNCSIKSISYFLAVAIILNACKKDDGAKPSNPTSPTNQGEVITTMKVTLTDSANTSSSVSAIFNDPDGDGGNGPVQFDTIKVSMGKTYLVGIELFDKTKNPEDTISNEVANEANDHHFFFHFSGIPASSIILTYLDQDNNTVPLPLGLTTKWRMPNTTGTGSAQIILKHQPGVKDGTETPGDTDVDVTFQVAIQ